MVPVQPGCVHFIEPSSRPCRHVRRDHRVDRGDVVARPAAGPRSRSHGADHSNASACRYSGSRSACSASPWRAGLVAERLQQPAQLVAVVAAAAESAGEPRRAPRRAGRPCRRSGASTARAAGHGIACSSSIGGERASAATDGTASDGRLHDLLAAPLGELAHLRLGRRRRADQPSVERRPAAAKQLTSRSASICFELGRATPRPRSPLAQRSRRATSSICVAAAATC